MLLKIDKQLLNIRQNYPAIGLSETMPRPLIFSQHLDLPTIDSTRLNLNISALYHVSFVRYGCLLGLKCMKILSVHISEIKRAIQLKFTLPNEY